MIINRYETVLANTETAKDIHYALRYKVFCEETGFEDAAAFPGGREKDHFDSGATHFLVWDRHESEWVGAMRLAGVAGRKMPCETICGAELSGLDSRRHRAVEFSRLCIPEKNRNTGESLRFGIYAPGGNFDGSGTPTFLREEANEIFLRLLRASFAWSQRNDIDYCYFIVNRALSRLLKRFGIPLEVVGAQIEHRGTRIPHNYNVHEADAGMIAALPGYRRMVRNGPAYVTYTDFARRSTGVPVQPAAGTGAALSAGSRMPLPKRLLARGRERVLSKVSQGVTPQ